MVDDLFVESTFEVALAEMLWRQRDVAMPEGIRQNDKLQGAMEFIRIWRGLSDDKKKESDAQSDDRAKMYAGGLEPDDDEDTPKLKPKK